MKNILLITTLLLLLMSCRNNEISGTITDYETDSLFIYKAKRESTYNLILMKSVPVTNGKFTFSNDSLELGLYCISLQNTDREETINDYGFLFMEPQPMQITISKNENKSMRIHASGSTVEEQYMAFAREVRLEENRLVYDSLERVFYQARENGDTLEMQRIKDLSISYYDKARTKLYELIDAQIEKYDRTYFAFYLYSVYKFQDNELNTTEEISEVRNYINRFDEATKQTACYKEAEELLDRFATCAIGCEAPEIAGVDREDNPIRLSDLRGKYVLVDFWSSGCVWCRKETPNLQKAYQAFKHKGFTILGVSSDYRKEDWIKAIEEDKSNWDQMLLPKNEIRTTMNTYCISGIPHILLVDPKGIILAKELRGDDIYNSVEQHINANETKNTSGSPLRK